MSYYRNRDRSPPSYYRDRSPRGRDRYDDRYDRYDRRDRDRYNDRYDRRDRDRFDDRYDRRDRGRRYEDRSFGGSERRGYNRSGPNESFGAKTGNGGARPERTVYSLLLSNLHRAVGWMDVKDIAKEFGKCTFADANKIRTGEGIVAFADRESMVKAKEGMNGYDLRGLRMKAEYEFPEVADEEWTGKVNNDHPPYYTNRDGDRHGKDDKRKKESRSRSRSKESDRFGRENSGSRSRSISR